jgi:hypothetical protein
MDIGTPMGLAFSSGINAYLPLLSFAIAARWLHLILLVVLTLADLVADKIPALDHAWDAIHTVIRPLAGAIVAAASSGQVTGAGLTVPLVAGAALAGMTHTTKAVTRVASTATTAGLGNTILSTLEDVFMAISVLLSLFVPILMVVLVGVFVLLFLVFAPRILRLFKRQGKPRRGYAP